MNFICGLMVVVLLLFSIPGNTFAQVVDIPDDNLRSAIAQTLGKAADAPITVLEMESLKVLRANDRGISELTGLETASRLRDLYLNNNVITDLSPLSGLNKLYRLELNHNEILSDLSPLSSLPNLNILFVEFNVISDLSPLTELLTLHDIRIGHNIIEDLSAIAGLHNLRGIGIGANLITDLTPLKDLKKLEWIAMSGNPPTDLTPLSELMSLRSIHSWGTPILDLAPLKDLPKLRVLDICGGEISDISALVEMTNLTEIYLVGNDITDISSLANLTNLTRLNLSHNDISDISALVDLPRLKWLAFSHNAVADVSEIEGLFEDTVIVWHNNPAFPNGGTKIVGPWLWMLVPGDRITDGDALSVASDGRGTEQKVATVGASEGKRVGNNVWTADNIAPSGGNNIGEMLKRQGVGNNGIVYGSATIESPVEQQTRMFVGHRDGIRLYLNGDVVYQKNSGDSAQGYHVYFPVTLTAGTNVLLVGLDNHPNHVHQFHASFGFDVGTEYTVNAPISRDKVPPYDVNEDGQISILDLILVGQDFGKSPPVNARSDVNGDGRVNITDIVLVAGHLGEITGIPAAPELLTHKGLSPTKLSFWIKTAEDEDDGSLVFQQGIAMLQRLLTTLTPQQTVLLANYPNPFNPETWIPYQLAAAADVTLTIWTADGQQVRKLSLGHKSAGIYESKSRAVYWDGKNDLGEPVASSIYFYTLSAGDFTATRKMLIIK
ncbi:MAG: leucine-rich repeat domain-containing protein [Candidatus Poribacteria bacterium]|nr:leucine-rich repeat domain-containing protein [Candidatus Poribacteria bacterium]